ncbi:MAG: hypothetical protein U9R49_01840 [Bacteroidota bacterium]|nr:hypothetical protein [Bacteroidota bacterium]
MPNGRPPIVWHLDTTQIVDKFDSPPDRLTLIKWIMKIYEANLIPLDDALAAFEKLCSNQMRDKNLDVLIKNIMINADTRIDDIFECLGIDRKS